MKYTAEEVRARVNKAWQNHDEHGRVFITMGDAMALVETILPECIEAGEAKALGICPKHGVEYVGECSGCAMTLPEKDFTYPPAQAVVTDAVVQRAEQAFWPAYSECTRVHGARKNAHATGMRAALLAVWPNPPAMQDDWRIAFFERWREAAHEKGYAGIAEAITAAPTAILRGTAPTAAPPIDLAAVREVIESHTNEAKNLRHDPELQDYLYEQADKLTAALQEKGNG